MVCIGYGYFLLHCLLMVWGMEDNADGGQVRRRGSVGRVTGSLSAPLERRRSNRSTSSSTFHASNTYEPPLPIRTASPELKKTDSIPMVKINKTLKRSSRRSSVEMRPDEDLLLGSPRGPPMNSPRSPESEPKGQPRRKSYNVFPSFQIRKQANTGEDRPTSPTGPAVTTTRRTAFKQRSKSFVFSMSPRRSSSSSPGTVQDGGRASTLKRSSPVFMTAGRFERHTDTDVDYYEMSGEQRFQICSSGSLSYSVSTSSSSSSPSSLYNDSSDNEDWNGLMKAIRKNSGRDWVTMESVEVKAEKMKRVKESDWSTSFLNGAAYSFSLRDNMPLLTTLLKMNEAAYTEAIEANLESSQGSFDPSSRIPAWNPTITIPILIKHYILSGYPTMLIEIHWDTIIQQDDMVPALRLLVQHEVKLRQEKDATKGKRKSKKKAAGKEKKSEDQHWIPKATSFFYIYGSRFPPDFKEHVEGACEGRLLEAVLGRKEYGKLVGGIKRMWSFKK